MSRVVFHIYARFNGALFHVDIAVNGLFSVLLVHLKLRYCLWTGPGKVSGRVARSILIEIMVSSTGAPCAFFLVESRRLRWSREASIQCMAIAGTKFFPVAFATNYLRKSLRWPQVASRGGLRGLTHTVGSCCFFQAPGSRGRYLPYSAEWRLSCLGT